MHSTHHVQCHPDKLSAHLTDEETATAVNKFHTLSKAYEVLSNRESKATYDANSQGELCLIQNRYLVDNVL